MTSPDIAAVVAGTKGKDDIVLRLRERMRHAKGSRGMSAWELYRDAAAEIERLRRLSVWQDASTAPKDGKPFLAELADDEGIEIIEWEQDGFKGPGWVHSTGRWSAFPTRWLSLPATDAVGASPPSEPVPALLSHIEQGRSDRVAKLEVALTFYRDAWLSKSTRGESGLGGLEWRPTEKLLDDCGNLARAALSTQGERK